MDNHIKNLEIKFKEIKNGFKHIEKQAKEDFKKYNRDKLENIAYISYKLEIYQMRMYAVFLLGYLADDEKNLQFLKEEVSKDYNWRVQEILAKSFDEYCKNNGYENSLEEIDNWLNFHNPNTKRAVTEGLRIWTSRPYFKENPLEAIKRLSKLKEDNSEYLRKSVGNALRDISKNTPILLEEEVSNWDLNNNNILQVYKLASKFII